MRKIYLLILIATFVFADPDWENYKAKFNLKFEGSRNERVRYLNYRANKNKIEKHNADPTATYQMAENEFTHMDYDEVAATYYRTVLPDRLKRMRRFKRQTKTTIAPNVNSTITFGTYTASNCPSSVNFQYLMRPPTDQGGCASCWAFSVMGQLEGLLKYKNKSFNSSLSPQYLVSCDTSNSNCGGGWPYNAMTWLQSGTGGNNMAPTTATYPYTASYTPCQSTTGISLGINSTTQLYYANETTLMTQLANFGPQVVSFFAPESLIYYSGGVFQDYNCFTGDCTQVNHAVVVVGYGTDSTYGRYWLIKNSLGPTWGEKGYFRLARNKNNMCNIACWPLAARLS